ncbi:nicotinamide mononucleotide transporter [Anabaena cylindrica FACHB-243]|uniref:Nicotinamide mononucleotide transporter PnuC n=1 Tax=Anabaena cylindrica (strain ATCC 27899 / PCC 7122) TaxID=272123 RepID=K9Z8Z2_ANACC|nr:MULTISPECIES: nicotinamide riboside transporter PnuC [Anabaena]AFZ55668.1 nicotinamide mononucleotide transporter PnuC [Anabaena cylindrica PCC 7122]MBD2420324.1 nicotinamide mononucleotide transporter [Anabaena cylindrica FACHB-243]MBY5282061.1 nicotinamide mononucleotide transporter [Anabaena sp. CCAP 1446/1C]MBY5309641.1 nicotinamide mononucleotide transporter [Anabaena sp. CCAP 1446/1C]MCM2406017.1 nicotinamide riboside transporter PnuC [Anabaena sp. CCAP 1446/1C]
MTYIEIIAAIFGLVSVWLTVKENIWCWPTGLVMVFLYIFVFYEARLYSDAILQVIYIFLQIYGWYAWLHGGNDDSPLAVTRISNQGKLIWSGVAVVGTFGLGYIMHNYTDAALPYPDASITILSLIAQWLMAKKILECWIIWIMVDLIAVGVYAVKHLYPTTGLYTVFLVLAVLGYKEWKRAYKKLRLG